MHAGIQAESRGGGERRRKSFSRCTLGYRWSPWEEESCFRGARWDIDGLPRRRKLVLAVRPGILAESLGGGCLYGWIVSLGSTLITGA
ncbi:hypothetical protein chiPu_0016277 [Chiloscyllium punctatum]|uniref:Uncharacterized protein n=1 Tax=Chiloscyllium punctatum TaxID=137246 RepID=A0A401T579_CHIPU|nr:hypothetical protein [Chiloscyllium punctatum]